jgi:hypothetical protein
VQCRLERRGNCLHEYGTNVRLPLFGGTSCSAADQLSTHSAAIPFLRACLVSERVRVILGASVPEKAVCADLSDGPPVFSDGSLLLREGWRGKSEPYKTRSNIVGLRQSSRPPSFKVAMVAISVGTLSRSVERALASEQLL